MTKVDGLNWCGLAVAELCSTIPKELEKQSSDVVFRCEMCRSERVFRWTLYALAVLYDVEFEPKICALDDLYSKVESVVQDSEYRLLDTYINPWNCCWVKERVQPNKSMQYADLMLRICAESVLRMLLQYRSDDTTEIVDTYTELLKRTKYMF